jgi:hypothetical protein
MRQQALSGLVEVGKCAAPAIGEKAEVADARKISGQDMLEESP